MPSAPLRRRRRCPGIGQYAAEQSCSSACGFVLDMNVADSGSRLCWGELPLSKFWGIRIEDKVGVRVRVRVGSLFNGFFVLMWKWDQVLDACRIIV